MNKKYNYIDLFAGCGGLSLGLHNSGWQGVFAVEKNKDAFLTLKHNLIDKRKHFIWPDWLPQTNLDIDQVLKDHKENLENLAGSISLVVGGPPCQGFSVAGLRKEGDQRNNLIHSYIKFIEIVKPEMIFFENVKGFTLEFKKNKKGGIKYSEFVLKALRDLGYKVKGELTELSVYGVPQRRTRFILAGVRSDVKSTIDVDDFFKITKKNSANFLRKKGISINTNLSEAISDIQKSNGYIDSSENKNFKAGIYGNPESSYQKYIREDCENLFPNSHRFANHKKEIIEKFEMILQSPNKNISINKELREKFNIKKHRVVPLSKTEKCPTLTTLPDDFIHYSEPRILTVREYARIQTFPDWYEFLGQYTTGGKRRVNEVPRYTQIGNAIPPLFGEQSGLTLKKIIDNAATSTGA
ncbi:DNA cytosine methyltransferase [Spirosoma pollinicola]|uniref:Cytosine-specific methyltransferase n=1 Tax=Spirosoma pollinicola TaxID=2057025 RepID=A0A2K8ZB24_9BACT|nr:DNA cytosine methyltransferase [Spirosoma pollinicola]AUD07091.1 DNA (cytosine-5-)-methyltransferase [Spirosoma pollinicola]